MRYLPALTLAVLLAAGCSTEEPVKQSPNVARWKAGDAVVVLTADVAAKTDVDVEDLGKRPGVIAASVTGKRLRLALSRQALLVDLVALKNELTTTSGLTNVRETVTPPTG